MLVRHLADLPTVRISRGWELTGLSQHEEGVELQLSSSDGETKSAKVRYAIGADGARSKVRELLGIEQTDLGFSYEWLVLDVVPHEPRTWNPYVVQLCNPARPTTLVNSGPGRRRWEFMRLPSETIEELNTAETAWKLLAQWDIRPDNATLERHTVYTFRGCWANQWKQQHVLLAGDAAHLMPPFLGQGLCAGMRDAIAMSWRLAMVLRREAPDALLDSYGPERSEHVQEIVRQAVEIGRVICMIDPAEVAVRDEQMKAAICDPSRALKPPPEPRLGNAGLYLSEDPNAGYLSIQGRVAHNGREGFFDDVVGSGWQLIVRSTGERPHLSADARQALDRLGGIFAIFDANGNTLDLDGDYDAWFDRLGAGAVLVRPDLYIFGTAPANEAGTLATAAGEAIDRTAGQRTAA